MNILGLSCFYHDSAACLVRDGEVVAAVEEERLTRRKHDSAFPFRAIASVLLQGEITAEKLDAVVFYEKTFDREAELRLSALLKEACGYEGSVLYCDHSLSHAAASYYASPFDEAAVLIVDGTGAGDSTSLYAAKGSKLTPLRAIQHPQSLGLFYAAMTDYLGFEVNEGEYKVMGLASYGQPEYLDKLRQILRLNEDGSFALDLSYFAFEKNRGPAYSAKVTDLLGPAREPETEVTLFHMNLAASVQKLIEEALLGLVHAARRITGQRFLCLGGALAHNIVANARIRESGIFDDVFIHFASADNGAALGAALYGYYAQTGAPKMKSRAMPYLGPAYTDEAIEKALKQRAFSYKKLDRGALVTAVAELLREGKVVGWHQGRMEFGPRALGSRSILASACEPDMKTILNARVKHREEFRPFAPVILAERADEYFELTHESPFMLYGAQVRADKRARIPSVTHVDGSARPQTIKREDHPLYYDVIKAFADLSGVPVLVNTSFNIRGEPIVCTPEDALNCFAGTDIEALAMGSYLVRKDEVGVL